MLVRVPYRGVKTIELLISNFSLCTSAVSDRHFPCPHEGDVEIDVDLLPLFGTGRIETDEILFDLAKNGGRALNAAEALATSLLVPDKPIHGFGQIHEGPHCRHIVVASNNFARMTGYRGNWRIRCVAATSSPNPLARQGP